MAVYVITILEQHVRGSACACVWLSFFARLTWYLSEWCGSSEDSGEITGDSPSRLMCTDNRRDCGKKEDGER